MKKILLIASIIFCSTGYSLAQDYNTGIGIRGGWSNGLTIKHFISSQAAVEGIFASRWRGVSITGLYEIHNQAFKQDRLNWYYGGGAHIGFWDGKHAYWAERKDYRYTVVGIDGILGLEYNFKEIPINLSVDWKPEINLIGYTGFWGDEGALSVRFIF